MPFGSGISSVMIFHVAPYSRIGAEIDRFIGDRKLRRLDHPVALLARVHGEVENAAHQQRSLDRVRRTPLAEMVLNRVRQGFEQVPILPGPT